MTTAFYRDRLAAQWRRFGQAENGNIAMIFAVAIIPVIGLVGAAIDYSRANSLKASMQAAADAAALAVSKEAATLTSSQVQSKAQKFFNALFSSSEAQNLQINASYSKTPSSQVVVNASAAIKPRYMSMSYFGISQVPVKVSSTTTWGSTRLRVALALDNTGSMKDDGKMAALKTATTNLLAQLKSAATGDGDVYVSIIPFSRDVNVGSGNKDATWLDWTEYGSCSGSNKYKNYDSYDTKKECLDNDGDWTEKSNHSGWNGCVTDRGKYNKPNPSAAGMGYDQKIDAPDGTAKSKYPAHQYDHCPQPMIGLKDVRNGGDWTSITNLVTNMSPSGSTNQPIGLVWAWQSLVGGGPLTVPSYDSNYQYQHIIILLSDGLNTQDRWYGNGSSVSSSVDDRMYDSSGNGTCANIKNYKINDKAIVIYTVHVNTGGDPKSTLLENCASKESDEPAGQKFFHLTTAGAIDVTFNQIGTNLSRLRVAK